MMVKGHRYANVDVQCDKCNAVASLPVEPDTTVFDMMDHIRRVHQRNCPECARVNGAAFLRITHPDGTSPLLARARA